MSDPQSPTPGVAWFVGLLAIVCGLVPMLEGAGVFGPPPSAPGDATPAWVVFSIGLMFVLVGLDVIFDYAIERVVTGPDGNLPADAPPVVQAANYLLGFAILGLMTAVFGWVAFGRGTRQFSTSISLPFVSTSARSSELTGRVMFGGFSILWALAFVACGVSGVKRVVRGWRATASRRRHE